MFSHSLLLLYCTVAFSTHTAHATVIKLNHECIQYTAEAEEEVLKEGIWSGLFSAALTSDTDTSVEKRVGWIGTNAIVLFLLQSLALLVFFVGAGDCRGVPNRSVPVHCAFPRLHFITNFSEAATPPSLNHSQKRNSRPRGRRRRLYSALGPLWPYTRNHCRWPAFVLRRIQSKNLTTRPANDNDRRPNTPSEFLF